MLIETRECQHFKARVYLQRFLTAFFLCVCGVFGRARRCLDWFVYSDRDPVALEECLCREVETANQWYNKNVMIGDTEYTFSFPETQLTYFV